MYYVALWGLEGGEREREGGVGARLLSQPAAVHVTISFHALS